MEMYHHDMMSKLDGSPDQSFALFILAEVRRSTSVCCELTLSRLQCTRACQDIRDQISLTSRLLLHTGESAQLLGLWFFNHPPGSRHSWGLASCCPGCHHQAWPSACQECGQGGGGLHSPPKAETGSAFGSGQCRSPLCQDTNLPWPRSGWRCWWAIDYDQTFTLMRYQSKNPLYYRFLPLNTHEGLRVDCKLYGTIRWCVQWWQIQDRITKHCNWKIPISNDKTTNFSFDILNINFIV